MNKYVLTGSSCCLKSSIGNELKYFKYIEFINSDSDVLSDMRNRNIIDYNFYPRIFFKGYIMRMMDYLSNDYYKVIFERGMIDQLVYAKIMSTGWFDLDTELDYQKILDNTDVILNFEKSCNIDKYYILENYDTYLLHKIIDDPEFENSRRWDSYYTVEDYIKLRQMFHDYYIFYLSKISANYKIIAIEGDKDTRITDLIENTCNIIYDDIHSL
jgi:hypothetical protein